MGDTDRDSKRHRDRERGRATQRETDRDSERHRDRERQRDSERHTERESQRVCWLSPLTQT